MDNKLGIQDLAALLAEAYGMDAKTSQTFVKTVFEIVEEYIAKDKLVKIKGFGTFKLVNVSDRESINVNTGERIVIAGHSKLTFTPEAALKDAVNRPFADFETTPLNENTSTEEMERLPVAGNDNEDKSLPENVVNNQIPETQPSEIITEVPVESRPEEILTSDEPILVIDDDSTSVSATSSSQNNTTTIHEEKHPSKPQSQPAVQQQSSFKENPSYPMSSEQESHVQEPVKKKSSWILYVFLTILLMALSYVCGHYRLLEAIDFSVSSDVDTQEIPLVEIQEPDVEANILATDSLASDSLDQDTSVQDTLSKTQETPRQAPAKQEESAEDIAKYFPQVKNGEYWIVGDAGRVHHMQVGETLYRIARKELGSQDLVRYLIVFNDFEDPNIIHTGDPIRIPKLLHKTTGEKLP